MNIKRLPKSQIKITNSIAWKKWEKTLNETIVKFSKEIKVKGFRPGKAPRNIVEQEVGKDTVLNAAAEKIIREDFGNIIAKEKISAIGNPKVTIKKLAEGNELIYEITIAVIPEIKLNDWKKSVKQLNQKHSEEKTEVTDQEIATELEKLVKSRSKLITVNRKAKKGDAVKLDFKVLRDSVPIENGTATDHQLILGSNAFIPGFEEHIIGLQKDDEKKFELSFPKEYHEKNLAGKPAQFEIKIKLVQKQEIPEINDAFAKSLGDFKNLDALKKVIKKGFTKEKAHRRKEANRSALLEKIIEKVEVDIPKILLHEEIHKMFHELETQIQPTGMQLEQYLKQMNKTKADLEKEWLPQAEKRIKSSLALEKIAEENEIVISSEKIEEKMNETLQYYKNEKDAKKNIDLKQLYGYTQSVLKNEAVLELIERV